MLSSTTFTLCCATQQAELHTATSALAALDDDLDMIQQQLEHQMQAQDHNKDDARYGPSCLPVNTCTERSLDT